MKEPYIIRTCTNPELYLESYWYTADPSYPWAITFTSDIAKAMILFKYESAHILKHVHVNHPNAEYVRVSLEEEKY